MMTTLLLNGCLLGLVMLALVGRSHPREATRAAVVLVVAALLLAGWKYGWRGRARPPVLDTHQQHAVGWRFARALEQDLPEGGVVAVMHWPGRHAPLVESLRDLLPPPRFQVVSVTPPAQAPPVEAGEEGERMVSSELMGIHPGALLKAMEVDPRPAAVVCLEELQPGLTGSVLARLAPLYLMAPPSSLGPLREGFRNGGLRGVVTLRRGASWKAREFLELPPEQAFERRYVFVTPETAEQWARQFGVD